MRKTNKVINNENHKVFPIILCLISFVGFCIVTIVLKSTNISIQALFNQNINEMHFAYMQLFSFLFFLISIFTLKYKKTFSYLIYFISLFSLIIISFFNIM